MSRITKKSDKIAGLIETCRDQDLPAHYLGYFECFNRQMFYEAHDVLEELWLAEGKTGANYGFYKGLIQFAGAFVHLQKDRLRPAAALFKLSAGYLGKFPSPHERLDVANILSLSAHWVELLEQGSFLENPLVKFHAPTLKTMPVASAPTTIADGG